MKDCFGKILITSLVSLVLITSCWSDMAFAGDFMVSIVVPRGGRFLPPYGGRIVVKEPPMPFHVVIKNISNRSQELFDQSMSRGYNWLSFEIRDEEGKRKKIERKKKSGPSGIETFVHLKPGASKVIEMLIDPYEWTNVPIVNLGEVGYFRVRAIYKNKGKKIYSQYYDLEIGTEY